MYKIQIKHFKNIEEMNSFLSESFEIENKKYLKNSFREIKIIWETLNQLKSYILIYEEISEKDTKQNVKEDKKFIKEMKEIN